MTRPKTLPLVLAALVLASVLAACASIQTEKYDPHLAGAVGALLNR